MKKVKFLGQKDNDSKVVEITDRKLRIDGYDIADRLLEGVMFDVSFNEKGEITDVSVEERSKDYFEQFNQEKFLKEVKKYAKNILDDGDEVEISSTIKEKYNIEYAWIEVEDSKPKKAKPQPQPIKIGKANLFG